MNKAGNWLAVHLLGSMLLLPLIGAAADQASDLKCKGCVNSKDLEDKGIKQRDIAKNVSSFVPPLTVGPVQ